MRRAGNDQRALVASARGRPWPELVRICLSRLDGLAGHANAGIVFMADPAGEMADDLLHYLKAETGICAWFGAAGEGVIAGGTEISGESGLALMLLDWPQAHVRLIHDSSDFASIDGGLALLNLAGDAPFDARALGPAVRTLGGRSSSAFDGCEIAGVTSAGGCSGLWLGAEIPVALDILHGLRDPGPWRRITSAVGRTVLELDGRAATDAIAEDAGELLVRAPDRLVRCLMVETRADEDPFIAPGQVAMIECFDRQRRTLRISNDRPGGWLRVTYRNASAALAEIDRLTSGLRRDFPTECWPRAAILYSSVDRGHALFGPAESEAARFQAALGPIPLIGMRSREELFDGALTCGAAVLALLG
ncbi:MAG: hypothetical protein H6851_09175 [Geminicoccaceae bacterium]|nr:hypothetical protein [Geminicoccaceae bacterium]